MTALRKFIRSYPYTQEQKASLINYFSNFLKEGRVSMMKDVLDKRTRFIIPVLEDVQSSQNVSAIIRTVECFGMNDLHIISNPDSMSDKKGISKGVAKGATDWINIKQYQNSDECFKELKEKHNCRIIVTSPYSIPQLVLGQKRNSWREDQHPSVYNNLRDEITERHVRVPHYIGIENVPIDLLNSDNDYDKPIAVVFGNESHGISNSAIDHADASLTIPLYGFTESFNVHVSTALTTYYLNEKFRNYLKNSETKSLAEKYMLSPEEKNNTLVEWMRECVSLGDEVELSFMRNNGISIPTHFSSAHQS
ncbi:spoU protein [Naegleria gruberi]|uniref:SpoU protein n=1 Tax=Naegleria gruberi TaxID=5762 RepID=D2W1R5_NAEGR|nr:spoU protein [Naegleria gruberi]EFC36964.1 spoU protein [Naegleria gruberi]|eukprot:XP_002669708.1 spoU protein [Naegleria gruberi]